MKKAIIPIVLFTVIAFALSAQQNQQGQQGQRPPGPPSAEEQLAMWDGELDLTPEQEEVFLNAFTEMGEKMQAMMESGQRPAREDMEAIKEEMDAKLTACLTKKQIKTYEKVQENMMSQGQQGQGRPPQQ
ncbi:MAG: hypothetical protein PQJ59_04000 [Spirochaetales bacterium]|nr:hypothetical protein [Spirochaetales bacterium]